MFTTLYLDDVQILPDNDTLGAVLSVGGLGGAPSPRRETLPRPRYHGDVDFTQFYEGRVVSLEGYVSGSTSDETRERLNTLKTLLLLGSTHTLRFRLIGAADDEQVSIRVASALDCELAGAVTMLRWGVDLLAPDPRIYSSTEKSGDYDPVAAGSGSGLVFPLVFPLVFVGEATTTLSVTNEGNFKTPPTFTIEGPVTNPIVDNETTGKTIRTTGLEMAAGETAVIDVAAHTLQVAGSDRLDLIDASQTQWFELEPGNNDLRLRGTGMVFAQTSLAVAFRDARI